MDTHSYILLLFTSWLYLSIFAYLGTYCQNPCQLRLLNFFHIMIHIPYYIYDYIWPTLKTRILFIQKSPQKSNSMTYSVKPSLVVYFGVYIFHLSFRNPLVVYKVFYTLIYIISYIYITFHTTIQWLQRDF